MSGRTSYETVSLDERGAWAIAGTHHTRGYCIALASILARSERKNFHVYCNTKTGKRKHIFTARPKEDV